MTGLKVDLKREVLREKSLTTLSDAILAAERADAVEKFVRYGAKGVPQKPAHKQRHDGPVPMEIDAMNKGKQPAKRPTTARYSNARPKPTSTGFRGPQRPASKDDECYYCGKYGHYARDCYRKQND